MQVVNYPRKEQAVENHENVLFNLNDQWRIAFDKQQWLLQHRGRGATSQWTSDSFVGGRKSTLQRLIDEKGVIPTKEALDALEQLPENFLAWRASNL